MPDVGGKKFPYTKKGKAAAKKEAAKRMIAKKRRGDDEDKSTVGSRRHASRLKSFSDWRGGAKKKKTRRRKKPGTGISRREAIHRRQVEDPETIEELRLMRTSGWHTYLGSPRVSHKAVAKAADRLIAKGKMEPLTRTESGAGPGQGNVIYATKEDMDPAFRRGMAKRSREQRSRISSKEPWYKKVQEMLEQREDEKRRAWHKKHTKGDKTLEHAPVE